MAKTRGEARQILLAMNPGVEGCGPTIEGWWWLEDLVESFGWDNAEKEGHVADMLSIVENLP